MDSPDSVIMAIWNWLDFPPYYFIEPQMLWLWLVVGVVYVSSALIFTRIFPRLSISHKKAWIPFYNVALMFKAVSIPAVLSLVFVAAVLSLMYTCAALIYSIEIIPTAIATYIQYLGLVLTEQEVFAEAFFTTSTIIALVIAVVAVVAATVLSTIAGSRGSKKLKDS